MDRWQSYRRDAPFAALVLATAVIYLAIDPPPVHSSSVAWSHGLIERANTVIWASSHFGQVLDYLVLQAGRATIGFPFTPVRAMAVVTYGAGLVYLASLAAFASTLGRDRRIPMFLLGSVSPVTVFLHGDAALGALPAPFALLALTLFRIWDGRADRTHSAIPAIVAGIGAALHGAALILLPGVIALQIATDRARSLGAVARSAIAGGASFFGPTGALLIFYVLAFRNVTIIPGDANGGVNGQVQLFILPFQNIPANGGFRAYAFFSWLHLTDVLTMLAMGVPALAGVIAAVAVRSRTVLGSMKRRAPEWVMGAMGVVVVVTLYPGVGMIAGQYALVPGLALLQVLSLGLVLELDPTSWRWTFAPLLVATVAATVFDWQMYWGGAI